MTRAVELAQVASAGVSEAFKNRIINGAMVIDQRNAGAAVSTDNSFPVDRYNFRTVGGGVISFQRSTTAPAGFINSLAATVTTADASIAASDNYQLRQTIEGFNIADLGWGTANAATVTLSFWVRSSLTGTFGGNLVNYAANRSYVFQYTISVANTWEQKSITIAGDITGTWSTDNSGGITVTWDLGSGTDFNGTTANIWAASNFRRISGNVQLVSTNGATFYITGVQLEVGSSATSFEYRQYGTELALCQRYYYRLKSTATNYPFGVAQCYGATSAGALIPYPVTMRTAPSALEQSGTAGDYQVYTSTGGNAVCTSVPVYAGILTTTAYGAVNFTVGSGIVAGNMTAATGNNSTAYLGWSAEL